MPVPLGNFISKQVYDGLLKTEHRITNPYSCRFVDVFEGAEQANGSSWMVSIQFKFLGHLIHSNMHFRTVAR